MEVYSIINDLEDHTPAKSQTILIQQAFVRNRILLRKYSPHFQNTNQTMFLRKVRVHIKQNRSSIKSTLCLHRYSYPELSTNADINPNKVIQNVNIKIKTERHNMSCKSFERMSTFNTFKSVSNIPKAPQSLKRVLKLTKKSQKQNNSSKIKIVSLGQSIEISEEKIRSFISNRYRMTLARLKNWYNSPKIIQTPKRPSYFVNCSVREYLNRNFTKN